MENQPSLATKKMLKTIEDKYGSIKEYYAAKGRRGKGVSRKSGFADDKIGKDGLTGRERARIAGKKRRKVYVYGKDSD